MTTVGEVSTRDVDTKKTRFPVKPSNTTGDGTPLNTVTELEVPRVSRNTWTTRRHQRFQSHIRRHINTPNTTTPLCSRLQGTPPVTGWYPRISHTVDDRVTLRLPSHSCGRVPPVNHEIGVLLAFNGDCRNGSGRSRFSEGL